MTEQEKQLLKNQSIIMLALVNLLGEGKSSVPNTEMCEGLECSFQTTMALLNKASMS